MIAFPSINDIGLPRNMTIENELIVLVSDLNDDQSLIESLMSELGPNNTVQFSVNPNHLLTSELYTTSDP